MEGSANRGVSLDLVKYTADLDGAFRDFLTFVELQDRTANGLTQALKENLDSLNLESKLVAQAYDGAAVTKDSINGVQVQMKKFFPHAHYAHCYAYQLNLIIKKMASCRKRLKVFFSSLNGIGVFFTISPKCNSQLKQFCSAQIPRVCETRWNYISRIISAVRSNREQILEWFTGIQKWRRLGSEEFL